MKVLAFDIGIKNLAFCVLDEDRRVLALQNCNILPSVEPVTCSRCTIRASYSVTSAATSTNTSLFCKKHIPKTHTILPELMGKKLPPNKVLKELVKTHQCTATGHHNSDYIDALAQKFAFPYTQPKQANASKVSLEIVHDSLRAFALEKWPLFTGCTHVLLENQPVFKNPHMKSVQVLLFATLRDLFLNHGETPAYHFIHAKKKVTVVEKGDAGYAERKHKSEERLMSLFDSGKVTSTELYEEWKKSTKKSDMADALCMTADYMHIE